MKIQTLFYTIILCLSSFYLSAQIAYGFKVGLNIASFSGDLEQDDTGTEIESLKTTTGFHVGASVLYRITDRYGIKGDFLFSQKGTQQRFKKGEIGVQAAQLFYESSSGEQIGLTGTQDRFLRITNSYIEIPISGYAKFGKVEFFGGPYVSFLVASKGVGNYQFTSSTLPIIELDSDLEFNYLKDDIVDISSIELNNDDYTLFTITAQELYFYPNMVDAYHDFRTKDGNFFNRIDFGLNAGMAYYLNQGLYISGNLNYGLTDLTNSFYDQSRSALDGNQYQKRDDVDRNFTWQISVGFAF